MTRGEVPLVEQVGEQMHETATIDEAIETNKQLIKRLPGAAGPLWLKLKRDGGLEYDTEECDEENRMMLDELYAHYDIDISAAKTMPDVKFVRDVDRQRTLRTVVRTVHQSKRYGFTFIEHSTEQGSKRSFGVLVALADPDHF